MSIQIFCWFFSWFFVFLLSSYQCFLYSRYKFLSEEWLAKPSLFYGSPFHCLNGTFWSTKVLNFKSSVSVFSSAACAFGVLRNHYLIQGHEDLPPRFLRVLCFGSYTEVFAPFWVNFCVWCKVRVRVPVPVLLYLHRLLRRLLSPRGTVLAPYWHQLTVTEVCFWPRSSVPLVSACAGTVCVVSLKSEGGTSSTWFLFQNCFGSSGSREFPWAFKGLLVNFCKQAIWIVIF